MVINHVVARAIARETGKTERLVQVLAFYAKEDITLAGFIRMARQEGHR